MILQPKATYDTVVGSAQKSTDGSAKRFRAWSYLVVLLTAFWIIFALALYVSDITVLIVGMAMLATVALLSFLMILLAWAYQNNV